MAAQVTKCELTPALEAELHHSAGWRCLPYLFAEVQAGIAELWKCESGTLLLYVITRLDQSPQEWVVTWTIGTGVKTFAPLFIAHAQSKGWPLRVHVADKARMRLFSRYGFSCDEYVLRAH